MGQNVQGKSDTPVLAYADCETDARWQADANELYIRSGPTTVASVVWSVFGAFLLLILIAVIAAHIANGRWPDAGPLLGLAVFAACPIACFMTASRRDDVHLDKIARVVTVDRRCAFLRSRLSLRFDQIESVNLDCDAAKAMTMMATADGRRWLIVWGHATQETARIAQAFASHIGVPLTGD